ncbi:GntR family transcriptional regulator [Piscibacillus halophilus]|uniref:Transcriptional regulator, GntR family n=1 Tax=Piscibacillus halophilus TaxID=571933 RepID=A0A1H9FE96_9BACI|nr:GntR family transcriptional regulator [Piscibacillus halophilus]SEQ36266.1 transcriptional regulator, GntR family [Piscibacillus halophilus]
MNIQFNNRDPVYVQVVRHFKNQIAKGFLQPGQAIPSRRELANQLKINPNTAQRAYKEMEEEGLIKTEKNQPSRVTSNESILQDLRDELIIQAVNEFVTSVKSINVPLDDALTLVKQKYEGEKGDSDD